MASISGEDIVRMSTMIHDVFAGMAQSSASLTRYSKTTSVVGRVYIEEGIASEDIAAPLMGTLTQIYISYVLTALQLNNVIGHYEIVRNAIARVTTEHYVDITSAIEENGLEDLDIDTEATRVIELDKATADLASGSVIEFDFVVGTDQTTGKPATVTVPIHVSLIPAPITTKVAQAFMRLSFLPSMARRWKMWKAGEISFFKDLLFSRDLVHKYADEVREDDSNALRDMMSDKNKGIIRFFKSLVLKNPNNNAASSVLIFDAKTFEESSKENHIDFSNYDDRQQFFGKSMAMLVVVVDTLYESVDIYYNGLKQHTSVSFRMIEKAGKNNKGIDLKEFMNAVAKGQPKF